MVRVLPLVVWAYEEKAVEFPVLRVNAMESICSSVQGDQESVIGKTIKKDLEVSGLSMDIIHKNHNTNIV